MLGWAVGEMSPLRLYLASSSESLIEDGNKLISYDDAIAKLGSVTVNTPLPEGSDRYETGTELSFGLDGQVTSIAPDQNTGAYVYTQLKNDVERRIWIITANTIRARLDMASAFHIGGMVINNLGAPGNDPGLPVAINEFKIKSASSVPSQLTIQWSISDASGAQLSDATTGLGTPWLWTAGTFGQYHVQAQVVGGGVSDRGSVDVNVGEPPTPTPTPRPTAVYVPPAQTQAPSSQPTAAPAAPPPPPVSSGGGSGGFELGGQVPGYIGHAAYMQQAGMTWVKYQIGWSAGADPSIAAGMVSEGHGQGFKVLLSIAGPLYPSSIDFNSYVNFVRGVAALGPDAIEVWNEMNLDRQWPTGQLDPTSYVNNMLAPSFNAIKSVNPNIMVIIGALAPTGFDNTTNAWSDQRYIQGMYAAGAYNYANCLGVHHNSGTTSPSATTGHVADAGDHHYSWYFLPTIQVSYNAMGGQLPVCLTEFGYLTPEGYGPLPSTFSWGAGTTVAQQAAWLAEGVQIARNLGYIRLAIIWNVDFTQYGDDPQAGYAIVRPDGSCPACASLAAVK